MSQVPVLAEANYAAIIKRYDDAGDARSADIIRKQWEVAQAAEGVEIACSSCGLTMAESHTLHDIKRGVAALAQVQVDTQIAGDAGAAQNCRSSEKVQAMQDDPRQLIVVGGQRLVKSILLNLQRDAARYRWLRDKADSMVCTAAPMVASLDDGGRLIGLIDGDELDAAVDVAIARPPARHALKTKRVKKKMNSSSRLLRLPAVMDMVGLKRTSIYDRIKSGTFPPPVQLGPRAVAWAESEVIEWQNGLSRGVKKAVT